MNTTNNISNSNKGFYLVDKSEISHLKNRHLNNAIRISEHLIQQDIKSTHHKLSLLALERYYMIKYLKSIRTRVEGNNKKRSSVYSLSLRAFYSYALRKLRSVVKYICELSKVKKVVDFIRIPNVTIVHCERLRIPHLFLIKRGKKLVDCVKKALKCRIRKFRIPQYSTLKSEIICRIIEVYKYKIPNYITYKRRKY